MDKRLEITSSKIEPRKPRINWAAVYQYLLDYCNDTTIHGFKVKIKILFFTFFVFNFLLLIIISTSVRRVDPGLSVFFGWLPS